MILPVLKYGHPVLRRKGARIENITPEIEKLIKDMFETMRASAGVGLAAQQVGHALQLMVLDVREAKNRPSTMEMGGTPADVDAFMPMALINPLITPAGKAVAGPEGCLSFPEIYTDIERPESVEVSALNQRGNKIEFKCGGLLARAVQHEMDHLQGILFIDRMSAETKAEFRAELDVLQSATKTALKKK